MIPVSKIKTFTPEVVGELVSYRRGYCVGYIATKQKTLACTTLVDWCLENGITFPDYSETISANDFSWNRIEYATLSLSKDIIKISDLEETFGDDELYLVNPYLIWYLGTQVFDPEVPYRNESEPLDEVIKQRDYLKELFISGKSEGWYEAIYRYNNNKDRITKTADNFVKVRTPKVLEKGEVAPMLVTISKKPWYFYGLEREEHIICGQSGFYVVVCFGGEIQFIAEMGAYLDESKCEAISGSENSLTAKQLALCSKIMKQSVTEML